MEAHESNETGHGLPDLVSFYQRLDGEGEHPWYRGSREIGRAHV